MEKWGYHQEKKFFIDNAVQDLILFKEGHSGPIETACTFGGGSFGVGKKGRNFL